MKIKTYDAVKNRLDFFNDELDKFMEGAAEGDNEQYSLKLHCESPVPSLELDLYFEKFPTQKDKEIELYYNCYLSLSKEIELFKKSISYPDKWRTIKLIQLLEGDVLEVVKHLSAKRFHKIETPEPEIKEIPKQTTTPKGQTVLTREQTALLFWYLREKSVISPGVNNKNIAAALELMTGYAAKQFGEILKMPNTDVSKLGKDEKKVTKNDLRAVISQFRALITRIEKDLNTNEDIKE